MSNPPFIAIGNNELGDEYMDAVRCPMCDDTHPLKFGTSRKILPNNELSEPVINKSVAFYSCGGQTYLAGVGGRYMPGLEGASIGKKT